MKNKTIITVITITAIGFAIRATSLSVRSIWFDEAFSFFVSNRDIPGLIRATAADNHPPLYYILLHYWQIFGISEIALRSLSVIFGVLALPVMYLTGKTLHSHKVGVIATTLLATAPLHVFYSQETRMYALAILLNLAMFFFFIKVLRTDNRKWRFGWSIAMLIGLYTHYYFVFSWLLASLIYFYQYSGQRKKLLKWMYLQGAILFLYLPWMMVFRINNHPQPWRYEFTKIIPATFASYGMGGLAPNNLKIILLDSPYLYIKVVGIILSLWLLAIFAYGIVSAIYNNKNGSKKRKDTNILLPASFILFPIGVATFISFIYPIYSLNSFSIFSPFYFLTISLIITKFIERKTQKLILGVIITLNIIILIFMKTNPIFQGNPIKIVSQKPFIDYKEGDVIAHASIYSYFPFRYYHNDNQNEFLIFKSGLSQNTLKEIGGQAVPIEDLEKKYNRIWFVGITFLSPPQDVQSTVSELSHRSRLVSSSIHDNIEIYEFELEKN